MNKNRQHFEKVRLYFEIYTGTSGAFFYIKNAWPIPGDVIIIKKSG